MAVYSGGRRRRRVAGFTLIELIMAVAIGTIAVAMTLRGMMSINDFLVRIQQRTLVTGEVKLLNEYVASALRNVGGGSLPHYAALWVDDNYGGGGGDRIISGRLKSLSLQSVMTSFDGTWATLQRDASNVCPLGSSYLGQQVIIVSNSSDAMSHWESRYAASIDAPNCKVRLNTGLAPTLSVAPSSNTAYTGGTLHVVDLQVVWVDRTARQLKVNTDTNLDGVAETGIVADRVFDLQAALGYDVSPWDWQVADTGGVDDEWLFNASGDTLGVSDGQGLARARRTDLRMIRLGVITGGPLKGISSVQYQRLLNGTGCTGTNWFLAASTTTVGLRNYGILR